MDAALLLPLLDRCPSLAAPCRLHPEVWEIGEEASAWARTNGLVIGDPDSTRLGRGRFERMAARMAPESDRARVVLLTKWLTWLFSFDDQRDEGELGSSATAVDALYRDLIKAIRRGSARPGAGPLEAALAELWQQTGPLMSSEWRRRFITHMEWHRAGCMDEAVNRRTGEIPGRTDYPLLRRRTNGPFMLDLAEPVLGAEIPEALAASRAWQVLVDGTNDITAWCNDIASYAVENARGDKHNYVVVISHALGLDPLAAVDSVNDMIAERALDVQEAARTLPAEFTRLRIDLPAQRRISTIACALLAAPRAQIDWLLECGRYAPMPDPSIPAPRRGGGRQHLTLLAQAGVTTK